MIMPAQVESMFYTREKPWHGLGIELDNPPTSEDALVAAGLNWNVIQKPVHTIINDASVPIDGYKVNIRDKDGSVLGIVSDRYKVVQNVEAFDFVDNLLIEGVRYETAGSLFGGRKVWMLAILPKSYTILGDKIAPYLCFTNTHDGSGAIRVMLTPIRVVCNNTLNLALSKAVRTWSCIHKGDIKTKLEEAKNTLFLAESYMDNLCEESELLNDSKISRTDVHAFLEELFPIPEDVGSIKENNIISLRDKLLYIYDNAPDLKKFGDTKFKFISAISDFATHTPPLRSSDTYWENNFNRVLGGHPLIDKAYELLKVA
jgi:phage/plasmid-like protein (TIGR03299 family)